MDLKAFILAGAILCAGCAGDDFSAFGAADGGAGTGSGGADAGSGGHAGSAGGEDAGAGGTAGGPVGGAAGSSGSVGGQGGSGGTGGSGAAGGTGGSGGSAGAGGQGGSGGGQCVEHTPGEITQLCQGKCAYELKCSQAPAQSCQGQPGACDPDENPYAYCDDSQWMPQSPPPTLECAGCQRQGPPGACAFGSPRSFEYVCDPQRTNGIQDFDETDVDCGGRAPVKCGVGGSCLQNSDCELQACVNSVCANASNAPAGCGFLPNSTTICCPKSVDGWYRLASIDSGCPVNTFAFKNDGSAPAPPGCSANQIDPASVCCSMEFP